jgi:drug/metabolite transporter (DMT)-like permease
MTLWGSTFVVTKDVMAAFPPLTLAFIRVAIGSALLLPLAIVRRRRAAAGASLPRSLPWGTLISMGLVGVACYYFLFNLSLLYISASQGALVQSSIPAMTALVAVLWLGERASGKRIVGIVLSVVGVLIVFAGDKPGAAHASIGGLDGKWLGNLLMFASVIAWGVYTSLAKRVANLDQVVVTGCITAIGALLLLPGAMYELAGRELPRLTLAGVLEILYLGAFASGLAYLLYNQALKDMDASQAGVFANLIPVIGVITGIVFLGEPLSLWAICGGLVVMLGVWVTGSERPATAAAVQSA